MRIKKYATEPLPPIVIFSSALWNWSAAQFGNLVIHHNEASAELIETLFGGCVTVEMATSTWSTFEGGARSTRVALTARGATVATTTVGATGVSLLPARTSVPRVPKIVPAQPTWNFQFYSFTIHVSIDGWMNRRALGLYFANTISETARWVHQKARKIDPLRS